MRIDPTRRSDAAREEDETPVARESRRQAERAPDLGRHVDASLEGASLHDGGNVVIEHGERERGVGADHVRVGANVVDLATDEGAAAFANSLGLPDAQSAAIAKAIRHAHAGSRDELAGIARVWARAEQGHDIPSRMVLSGHCFGSSVWDGGTANLGEVEFSSVAALAAAMPRASARVEDLMISGCSSGYDGATATGFRFPLSAWKGIFPNRKTAWGYGNEHHSPSGAQAIGHIAGRTRRAGACSRSTASAPSFRTSPPSNAPRTCRRRSKRRSSRAT